MPYFSGYRWEYVRNGPIACPLLLLAASRNAQPVALTWVLGNTPARTEIPSIAVRWYQTLCYICNAREYPLLYQHKDKQGPRSYFNIFSTLPPVQMLLFGVETCIWIAASNSGMKKTSPCISVFNPVNRMHRSSSGSYWISCTQKSTADRMFAEQGRSPNKNTPDLGVCVYVEKILSLNCWCPSCDHILFSVFPSSLILD